MAVCMYALMPVCMCVDKHAGMYLYPSTYSSMYRSVDDGAYLSTCLPICPSA